MNQQSVGEVIEIPLDEDDGRTLVARARGQVAQRADEVGNLSGGCTLGRHIAHEVIALGADALGNGFTKCFAREVGKIVVGKVFEFDFVGCTNETIGVCGGDYGVGKFPDFTLGVLECAIAVYHNLDALSCALKEEVLNFKDEVAGVVREEFDGILGRFVRAK